MTPDNVSQQPHPRKVALSDRERYVAIERGIAEHLQRKARAARAVAETFERARREYEHVADAARWRPTEDLEHVAASFGYSGLADWFSRGAPWGDYPTWCAEQCRAAYEATDRERRTDSRSINTRYTDIEIEQGRLDPSMRRTAIEYSTLCMAGRHVEAAVYLKQLRQERQLSPARVRRIPALHQRARRSTRRTVRSRRSRTTVRPTGDPGDGEPPEPCARGPPLSRVGAAASGIQASRR